jgi:hypothetical protein
VQLCGCTCLVDVKVDDQDSLQGMLLNRSCCRHRNVVEDAEALAPILRHVKDSLQASLFSEFCRRKKQSQKSAGLRSVHGQARLCSCGTGSRLASLLGCLAGHADSCAACWQCPDRLVKLRSYRKGVVRAAGQAGGRRQAELQHRARRSEPAAR